MADDDAGSDFQVGTIVPGAGTQGPTSTQEQSVNRQLFDTPQNTPPPARQTPRDKTDEGQELRESIRQNEVYLKELMRQHEQANAERQKNVQMYEQAMKVQAETEKLPADSQRPTPQYDSQQKLMGAVNQTGSSWLSTVGVLGFALAGMLGKRHSGIGSQMFVGSLLKSYAEGRNEAMKQQREEWHRQAEYEHQVNTERNAEYRAALENERLNWEQKKALILDYAKLNGDLRMQGAAERGDIREVQTILNQQRQALARYNKEYHTTSKSIDYMTGQHLTSGYDQWVRGMWMDAHNGQPPHNESETDQAHSTYRFSDYLKQKKPDKSAGATVDPTTGKLIQGSTSDDVFGVGTPNKSVTPEQRRRFDELQRQNTQGGGGPPPAQKRSQEPEEDDTSGDTSSSGSFGPGLGFGSGLGAQV